MAIRNNILSMGRGEVKIQLPGVKIIFAMKFRIRISRAGT